MLTSNGGVTMDGIMTYFAPAERISGPELQAQIDYFVNNQVLVRLINYMPFWVLVLNQYRQAVFVNQTLLNVLGLADSKPIMGWRPGEIFRCEHSAEMPGGCGTSKFCQYCGAVNAVMSSVKLHHKMDSDCTLTNFELVTIDMKVNAIPIEMTPDEYYTLLVMRDNSDSQRRSILERVFFHDIRNMLAGISLVAQRELRQEDRQCQESGRYLEHVSNEIIDEISAQQELLSAEDGNLKTEFQETSTGDLLESVVYLMENHPIAERKKLVVTEDSVNAVIVSDERLLRRVLVNMVKNGLGASASGEQVTIKAVQENNLIVFSVHNQCYMPENVQLQLFKRSFSTKGAGRGIGTYSMKLLTEKYLHGKISFTSDPVNGTVFTVAFPLTPLK